MDEVKYDIIRKVKNEILEEVTKMDDIVRDEVETEMENLGGDIDHLDIIVNSKIEAAGNKWHETR